MSNLKELKDRIEHFKRREPQRAPDPKKSMKESYKSKTYIRGNKLGIINRIQQDRVLSAEKKNKYADFEKQINISLALRDWDSLIDAIEEYISTINEEPMPIDSVTIHNLENLVQQAIVTAQSLGEFDVIEEIYEILGYSNIINKNKFKPHVNKVRRIVKILNDPKSEFSPRTLTPEMKAIDAIKTGDVKKYAKIIDSDEIDLNRIWEVNIQVTDTLTYLDQAKKKSSLISYEDVENNSSLSKYYLDFLVRDWKVE